MKLHIKTVTGYEFTVTGECYNYSDGVHYLDGQSFPDEIVEKVEVDE